MTRQKKIVKKKSVKQQAKKKIVKKRTRVKKTIFEVISVGSAAVDCFVELPGDFTEIKHGSKVLLDGIELHTGGGGSNVAVGLSRLGVKTGFIGEIGDDQSASMIKHELKKENVEFLVQAHSRHQTAYSVVLENKGSDRAILVHKGASSYLHPYEIPKNKLSTRWFYFASVIGDSLKTMNTISGIAEQKKINIYFNPSGYMVKNGGRYIKNIISKTTVLAMNKEEAQSLLKTKSNSIELLLKHMKKKGPEICIITDGKNGVFAYDGVELYHQKTHSVKLVDTTGAGDAFGTGFLAAIIKKGDLSPKTIRCAMKVGVKNSESVIGKVGAKTGLLTKEHLKC